MWTNLLLIALAGSLGYFIRHWMVVRLRMALVRTRTDCDENNEAWLAYQRRIEKAYADLQRITSPEAAEEMQRLRMVEHYYNELCATHGRAMEEAGQDLRRANATINRLEASLAQADAAHEDLLAKYRAARAVKAPTDALAVRILAGPTAPAPEPPVDIEHVTLFDQDQSERIETQRRALAVSAPLPVVTRDYPASKQRSHRSKSKRPRRSRAT